ncbi:MAG: hypothetical protein Q9162_006795 [Coniocarpon cinnabarinum]
MDKAKRLLQRQPSYQPIGDDAEGDAPSTDGNHSGRHQPAFSPVVYGVFLLLGVAMLWPWNSFMSAAPYFQFRFRSSKGILSNFQAAELSVSTVANLGSVWVLAKLQAGASYPRRIVTSLSINTVAFAIVAISTRVALGVAPGVYLGFLILAAFTTSLATGFMQNGAFAYVAGYRRSEYVQAIMLGQAVAGVLPPIVQISSVLSAAKRGAQASTASQGPSTSAFAYFLTAAGVSALTLSAYFYLLVTHKPSATADVVVGHEGDMDDSEEDPLQPSQDADNPHSKQSVPLTYLGKQLFFPGAAVFLTFGLTMVFPVFTQEIFTTNPNPPPFLQDASFIPLGLLIWNAGDLAGRVVPLASTFSLAHRPKILFALSVARVVFIPLYLVCNIVPAEGPQSAGAGVGKAMPDLFYFAVVQFPFGLSNGYLGSCCMMGAGHLVKEDEREASGAFMGLLLVAGLAVGSFCSFFVGNG